jgi:hypothetical protein
MMMARRLVMASSGANGTVWQMRRLALVAALALAPLTVTIGASPAQAQASGCERIGVLLKQREGIMKRINGMGKKNVDPGVACNLFGSLASNGAQTLAFANENKDWCQIPDEFVENLKAGQSQVTKVRAQACGAARQRSVLEQRARQQAQQAQQGGNSAFSGVDGFSSGPWRVPQGAL